MKLSLSLFIPVFAFSIFSASAQTSDDVLLKAMKDEIESNINGLKLPDSEKPFFIMYGVVDQKDYAVSASMGSIIYSTARPERFRSTTRVLVGDYRFNDESLEDHMFSQPSQRQISLPIDDDYWGIRRSFWSATDNVYQSAAKNFEKNKETLRETGKKLEDIPHRSFIQTPPVKLLSSLVPFDFNKNLWEARARKLSEIFIKHPSILNSSVSITYFEGNRYLVNTEGTTVKTPFSTASLRVIASVKNADGEQTLKALAYTCSTPDNFPDEAHLTEDINQLINQLEHQSSVQKLDQDYSGPVLVIGEPVAGVFASSLFFGGENIMASDNIPKLSGFQYDSDFSADNKVGKNITSELVSINAVPKMKTFNGTDLLGSFEVDAEGVVPADEVKIVDHGVLKTLLNNRTITNPNQKANGFSSGPGVLQVKIDAKDTEKSLRKKLLEIAKKQKLEYAIILRGGDALGFRLPDVFKVYVSDGREELVKGATMNHMNLKNLKHIVGATTKYNAYNMGGVNDFGRSQIGMTSYIVPDQILFDDAEVNRFHLPSMKEETFVKSPLEP